MQANTLTGVKYLYRYEINYTSEDGPTSLELREIKVIEETPKTYVIQNRYWQKKRVRKDAYNAYAHTQKDKALEHFVRRTRSRIRWYDFWQRECETAIELAKDEGYNGA